MTNGTMPRCPNQLDLRNARNELILLTIFWVCGNHGGCS